MKQADVFPYRSAVKAVEIVARAAVTMRPAEIAVELGVAESTIRAWKTKPDTAISVDTAERLRRMDKRLAGGAK